MCNMDMRICCLLTLAISGVASTFYGNDYYNDRYSAQGIAYTSGGFFRY